MDTVLELADGTLRGQDDYASIAGELYAVDEAELDAIEDQEESSQSDHNDAKQTLPPSEYTIGWICALETECVAAMEFLDEEHSPPETKSRNDSNTYTLGRVGKHNVVISILPSYGIAPATSVVTSMVTSFHNIRFVLMVGIGGGAPSYKHDIRLGDVVVSSPGDGTGGVFQYDFGKAEQDKSFRSTGHLNQPPAVLLTAVSMLNTYHIRNGHRIEAAINRVLMRNQRLQQRFKRPDPDNDLLYKSHVTHSPNSTSTPCCGSDAAKLVSRTQRTQWDDNPAIHYGVIASANTVMKDATTRDALIEQNNVLCFEMEAAGLMNGCSCLVIRGICDYSDSHKNDMWQGYAAMTAAAYAKDLLSMVQPEGVLAEKKVAETLSGNCKLLALRY
jgi:nucleoside phosphorylase